MRSQSIGRIIKTIRDLPLLWNFLYNLVSTVIFSAIIFSAAAQSFVGRFASQYRAILESPLTFRSTQENRYPARSTIVTSLPSFRIQWYPSVVELCQVYHAYPPDTLWRRLTSSVPRREFAIKNVTFTFYQDRVKGDQENDAFSFIPKSIVLLTGDSSSGKSTLLKLIQGSEQPVQGTVKNFVSLPSVSVSSSLLGCMMVAKPVLLEDREPLTPNSMNVQSALLQQMRLSLRRENHVAEDLDAIITCYSKVLLQEMSVLWRLDLEQKIFNFSPSQYYRFRLANACLESCLTIVDISRQQSNTTLALPGPILLLDEWMDTETSSVVSKVVYPSLDSVVGEIGGIVVSVTHKPNLYTGGYQTQEFHEGKGAGSEATITTITLSAGKILNVESKSSRA